MANREENLKKINEELEKLDDEQLEQVAGGFIREHDWAVNPNQENPILNTADVVAAKPIHRPS